MTRNRPANVFAFELENRISNVFSRIYFVYFFIGWIHNALDVAVLGPEMDLSYDFEHLGDSPDALEKLANGSHPFAKKLASAKKPAIIVGSEVLQRPDGAALMANAQKLAHTVKTKSGCEAGWRVLNVLHKVASQVSN